MLTAAEPAQRLWEAHPAWLTLDPDLDLTVPMRSVRDTAGSPWVDAVLDGDAARATAIAAEAGGVPFFLTRDLDGSFWAKPELQIQVTDERGATVLEWALIAAAVVMAASIISAAIFQVVNDKKGDLERCAGSVTSECGTGG